jgi:hypothetical protein
MSSLRFLMDSDIITAPSRDNTQHRSAPVISGVLAAWAFVYVFFTNGTPFDSPNRSEPCTTFYPQRVRAAS